MAPAAAIGQWSNAPRTSAPRLEIELRVHQHAVVRPPEAAFEAAFIASTDARGHPVVSEAGGEALGDSIVGADIEVGEMAVDVVRLEPEPLPCSAERDPVGDGVVAAQS